MNVLLLANNWPGLQVTEYLRAQGETIVGLGIHAPDRQRLTTEIVAASGVAPDRVFEGPALRAAVMVQQVRDWRPEIIVGAFWGYILKPEVIDIPAAGCINMHPGYLPYNRGMNPNVWPIVEGTPAGVTIHYVDAGIDTGDVIAQREVPVGPTDTGGTLYDRTLIEIVDLFKETWPAIRAGTAPRITQDQSLATHHRAVDVDSLDQIDLDAPTTARSLINRIRARTYDDRTYAYFDEHGVRVYVSVTLSESRDR